MTRADPQVQVVLLADADGAARWLSVSADGGVTEGAAPDPAAATAQRPAPRRRTIVVVPGTAAPAHWLSLPAHSLPQALAAARHLLQDHLATPIQDLHVAVGAHPRPDAPCPAVAVDHAAMTGWLRRAQALGLAPDAMIPDHMLLPPPTGDEAATVVACGGDWLVRTHAQSFRAEAGLAARVLGPDIAPQRSGDCGIRLAAAAPQAGFSLLQAQYAPVASAPGGAGSARRLAMLAVLALASIPLLWTAELLRYRISAQRIDVQMRELVAAALPERSGTASSPLAATRDALAQARAHDRFPHAAGALFSAVHALDGAALERIEWTAGGVLAAGIAHADPSDLDALAERLAREGLSVTVAGTRRADGRLASDIELVQAAP